MWKVVAADDEGYIREALKKLINWEKMDCDLIRAYRMYRKRITGYCYYRYSDA